MSEYRKNVCLHFQHAELRKDKDKKHKKRSYRRFLFSFLVKMPPPDKSIQHSSTA